MISGVLSRPFSEALLFGSLPLLIWFGFFLLVNSIVIRWLEPGLENGWR